VLTLFDDDGRQLVAKRAKPGISGEKYLAREAAVNARPFPQGGASAAPPLDAFLAPYLGEAKHKPSNAPVLVWAHCGCTLTLKDYLEGNCVEGRSPQSTTKIDGARAALANALGVAEGDVAWEVLAQLSLAVASLHDQGVLHR
jgi:hypothetical protein